MATRKEEKASFVIRFTQKYISGEEGKTSMQWRGSIEHVQGGAQQHFTEFESVIEFIQQKLADLTIDAMEDKTPQEQKDILAVSFEMWKKMATAGPKLWLKTMTNPIKGMEEIQKQISQVGENFKQKLDVPFSFQNQMDKWATSTKADYKNLVELIEQLTSRVDALHDKVNKLYDND